MEPAWNKWEDYSSGSGIQMKNQGLVDNQVLLQYILEKINGLGKIGCGRHISRMSIRKMGYFTLVQSTVELWTSEVTGHNNRSELFWCCVNGYGPISVQFQNYSLVLFKIFGTHSSTILEEDVGFNIYGQQNMEVQEELKIQEKETSIAVFNNQFQIGSVRNEKMDWKTWMLGYCFNWQTWRGTHQSYTDWFWASSYHNFILEVQYQKKWTRRKRLKEQRKNLKKKMNRN